MPATLKPFQQSVCDGILARLANLRELYRRMETGGVPDREREAARQRDAAVVLLAPTGAGKTLIAVEALRGANRHEPVLWFWFAPFTGLVEQSRQVIASQAPELTLFDLQSDRQLDIVRSGGVFVTTWAALAARNADSRRARQTGDAGLGIDDLVTLARAEGVRIGCVVDEAHHNFQRAAQARALFSSVLKPDYALLMTATPRDADMPAFEQATGYAVGEPADWAAISRVDAVEAGLLKRGVRLVRFVARDGDAEQLVDFEHLALSEAAATHRAIKQVLAGTGVALTPLLLVQVPDGKVAQEAARKFLIEDLQFAPEAVRVHTADEPDPDLLSLAHDPGVEVLVFKMAVALGFDAPRAFTLAALRGVRDADFAVQLIGRIVRKHMLLQGHTELPPILDQGYVFLANSQSQEGLLEAGQQINALATQAPELGTQTVVTVMGDRPQVQVVRTGESLSLIATPGGTHAEVTFPASTSATESGPAWTGASGENWSLTANYMLELVGGDGRSPTFDAPSVLALAPEAMHRYRRRSDAPTALKSERLPAALADFEARLVDFVNFSEAVLASRLRTRVRVTRSELDLFVAGDVREDGTDIWASLSPQAVAERAGQVRLRLSEANDRELHLRLLERFRDAIERSGAEVPADEETLLQQLDLVMVRYPTLLREAYRRLRHQQVLDVEANLPDELHSDLPLVPAQRALYGVFPPQLNQDELEVARQLDACPLVSWWHRNPVERPESVALYRWDDGRGFYPDFVVAMQQRNTANHIALLEVKGGHLWGEPNEVDKAEAAHRDAGRVFFVGRRRGEREFHHLRELQGRLETDGIFTLDRLRHA